MCHLTYAPAMLRRRLKNLVSVGSLPPFSVFAKLQLPESIETRSIFSMSSVSSMAKDYTHPSGLPKPEIRATFLAGPLGNKANKSLVETPVPVVIWRSVGDLPPLMAC